MKHIIRVEVSWTEDNFCCGWGDEDGGAVLVTAKDFQKMKEDFEESLRLHIQGCLDDGDELPAYLVEGDYDIEYNLDPAALIRNAETYTTMAALSRASGINQKQLSHYANGTKQPRALQIQRIKAGLHKIATQLMALG